MSNDPKPGIKGPGKLRIDEAADGTEGHITSTRRVQPADDDDTEGHGPGTKR
jgi:hypothetical protein